jgi:hypothetical protein
MNGGSVSDDLLNRGLPIHLAPVGNVHKRTSPIGNPKHKYLPSHRSEIEGELRGMIARWRREGMPTDPEARHPCDAWARVVGGILRVNGFTDFLGNFGVRRTEDEPVRKALGHLGAYLPDEWLTATEWAPVVGQLGLVGALIPKAERETSESRSRGLGKVLSGHEQETLVVETDDETLTLQLEKERRRLGGPEPKTRYRFAVLDRKPLPEDGAAD